MYNTVTEETKSLNGNTRNQTDANIRKQFGTIEDFLISSMSSQHGALSFINEGSTKRKEIIAKFLDLQFFDKKFKLAKDDSQESKILMKKLQGRDYNKEIEQVQEAIDIFKQQILEIDSKKFNLEAKYFSKKDEYEKKEYKKDFNKN